MEDWAARAPHCCVIWLVTTAAASGQCSPHTVGRWRTQLERAMLTAQADTYLRALGSRLAERPASVDGRVECAQFLSVRKYLPCDSHVKVRLTETESKTSEELRRANGALCCGLDLIGTRGVCCNAPEQRPSARESNHWAVAEKWAHDVFPHGWY